VSRKPWVGPNRRRERINDDRMDRVYGAYRLLDAYANPLRAGMPLSSTEEVAVRRATQMLRGPK
jgi:hypothetical protein